MKNKTVLVFLCLLALAIWAYNLRTVKNHLNPPEEQAFFNKPSLKKAKKAAAKKTQFEYTANFKDPFSPPARKKKKPVKTTKRIVQKKEAKPPPLTIDGLIWDKKNPMAVLKNTHTGDVKILSQGAVWNEVKVVQILEKSVTIRFQGKSFVLK